jgi:hypothetical protein
MREAFYEVAIFLYELISEALPLDTFNEGLGDTFQAIGDLVTSTSELLTEVQKTEFLVQQIQTAADFDLKQNKDGTFSFAKPSGYTDAEAEAIFELEFPEKHNSENFYEMMRESKILLEKMNSYYEIFYLPKRDMFSHIIIYGRLKKSRISN